MAALGVVIAGGGTGGHLFPGVAVARELLRRRPDAKVSFAGTARGLEARVVPKEGFDLDLIRSAGIKGRSIAARLRGVAMVPLGLLDAWRLISRRRPRAVIGVGGYSSGPVVLIAALRGIPTMLLEQNAMPGFTNRTLAPWVRTAALTYEETRAYFGRKSLVTGNPVRPEFFSSVGSSKLEVRSWARVLIVGGSQGAHSINMAMVAAAAELVRRHPGLEIVHQTGQRDLADVREGYRRAGVTARAEPFLDGMAGEVTSADVVICRAGATTLAELAAVGRPAVLVPFPAATDDHQRRNARVLETAGAAVLIEEKDRQVNVAALTEAVSALLSDDVKRGAMAAAMAGFARPDAAARIVDRLLELAGEKAAA
jgi:UDP-N-acetylglucosamine--N-acetylmuramyl-(pentapeptide) pyrophosphoryl-undecaprenol N-acetylglucosamine transferase